MSTDSQAPSEELTLDAVRIEGAAPARRSLFLRGPVALWWLARAARSKGRAFHVAVLVRFLQGLRRSNTVRVPRRIADLFCIDRHALHRALHALEADGLVTVRRRHGRSPVVRIVECPTKHEGALSLDDDIVEDDFDG